MTNTKAIKYSEEMVTFLSENRKMKRSDLTISFNKKFKTNIALHNIVNMCKRNKFYTGRTGHYKKGEKPWNKDKKGYMGANATSFKKGHVPHNTKNNGIEIVYTSGYTYKKIGAKDWQLKHRLIFIEHYGDIIGEDDVVRFKDGDKTNFEIENLELINKFEHLYLNRTKHNELPDELKDINLMVAKLERYVKERM